MFYFIYIIFILFVVLFLFFVLIIVKNGEIGTVTGAETPGEHYASQKSTTNVNDFDTYDATSGLYSETPTVRGGTTSGDDIFGPENAMERRKLSMRASQIYLPKDPQQHRELLERFLDSQGFSSEYKDAIRKMDINKQSHMMSEWYA